MLSSNIPKIETLHFHSSSRLFFKEEQEKVDETNLIEATTTFLVKTMDRPISCKRLLSSIIRLWPSAKIIVADDGETPFLIKEEEEKEKGLNKNNNIQIIRLPVDSGLSFSRNALVEAAKTPFIVLLDDDFEIIGNGITNVSKLINLLLSNSDISIVTGSLHLPGKSPGSYHYSGLMRIENESTLILYDGNRGEIKGFPNCYQVDVGINFFAARKDSLLKVKWDPALKLAEHEDFFLRFFRSGMKVACCRDVSILHYKEKGDSHYTALRKRGRNLWQVALRKHRLKKMILFNGYTVNLLDSSVSL